MESGPGGKSCSFLLDASLLYKDKCPELSRFLLQCPTKAHAPLEKTISRLQQDTLVCPYCCQWLQPDNHRMRLRPKRRPSVRVQRALRRKARGERLSPVQTYLLHRFQTSSSTLMATCHTCAKTSRHKGMSRDFMVTLTKTHSTPGSASKHKTPQSANRSGTTTPKTPGKNKTPGHTPRSSNSSNSSGPGSAPAKPPPKVQNWVVRRLNKILMREDSQDSKKGGLKNFLLSL